MSDFVGRHLSLEIRLQLKAAICHQIYMKPDANYVSRSGMNEVIDSASLLLLLIYSSKWQKSFQLIIRLIKVSSLKIDLFFSVFLKKLIGKNLQKLFRKLCLNIAVSFEKVICWSQVENSKKTKPVMLLKRLV